MKAEDIKDRETLEAWLRERPRRDAVVIAHRAALRVLPIWGAAMGEDWARESGLTALPLLRCGLISAVVSVEASSRIASEAIAAAHALASDPSTLSRIMAASFRAAINAADAAAASTLTGTEKATRALGHPAAYAVSAAADANLVYGASTNISDVTLLETGGDPVHLDLWSDSVQERFLKGERVMLELWDGDPPERWAFWRRWWEGAKTGQPLDPELQLAIVKGIDEETWKDPDKVAARIAEIEDAFNTERAAEDRLDEVIAATPNAERVEGNLDSGALILVPDSGIDGALFDYAARKVAGAISIIRLDGSNQYTALEADLAMLQAALEVTPGLPLELFDACASATGRLVLRCEIGDLPPLEKDPVLTDYRNRLRDAGADLYGNDPQTQSVVAARNALAGNDVFLEHPRDVGAAVEEIGPALEGHLATALPRDAKIASDPAASAEERKPATYRLVSRTLRIAKIAGYVVGGGAATIVGTKEVLEAIPVIQASPHFQKLVELALRWLGF
ncbi:hypothetical protein [Mameliella alba]|uniref:hypothetical protein n=1 Tax=Mameliella alba TaxID=561184 RepID=UPI001430822A|nr:hypothetical protein [Mameliella alba]